MFRVGLTEWFVLAALCILSVHCTPLLKIAARSNGVWQWNSTGNQCRVMICTCYMNGIYYDEGDEWEDPDDPCIRYRCLQNGFFKPIKNGCSFKGKCKEYNATWTEGCFSYRCESKYSEWRYTLIKTGCVGNNGRCMQVGERYIDRCDTYECQIVGSCYTLTQVKSGCLSKSQKCMPIYSFWHDECAVYQCKLDRGRSRSTIQIHSHDVMLWPRGEYALLETKHGCPPIFKQFWQEGYHIHWGEGHNDFSDKYDLKGNHTKEMMEHYFCVHRELNESTLLPVFQTYWEEGRYCIMAYNESCPKGFKEGMIIMLNQPTNNTNTSYGTLPDGVYNNVTSSFVFCCRYDGELNHPIVLPTRHPFALYMATNESKCQEVKGMGYDIEFFSHDDINNGTMRQLNGHLPSAKIGDNNTLIYVCYYYPLKCGCVDEKKNFVAMDDVIERDCVTYQCKELNNRRVLVVMEGGCVVEGKEHCVAENKTWVLNQGEGCYTKQCLRKVDNETSKITFAVETVLKECRDGDICRPLTYTKSHGCYSTQCQENEVTGETLFKVTQAGCSDGHGKCVEMGKTIDVGCITLKCDLEISKCGLVLAKGRCSFNDKCYDENEKWTHACMNFTCINNSNKTHYQWKSQVINKGCIDHTNKCFAEGERMTRGCVTYQCIWDDDVPGFNPVAGGCSWGSKCYQPNQVWTYGCSTYKCIVQINGTHTQRSVKPLKLGCSHGNKCVKLDDTFKVNCITYQCLKSGKQTRKKLVKIECKNPKTGKCVEADETTKYGCVTYRCHVNKTRKGYRYGLKPEKIGCRDFENNCIAEGDTTNNNCYTYECMVMETPRGFKSQLKSIGSGCNYNGTCHKINEPFQEGCAKKMCKTYHKNNKLYYRIISLSCKLNGECYDLNNEVRIGCSTFKCVEKNDHSCHRVAMKRISTGCNFNGNCMADGDTTDHGCTTYQCVVTNSYRGFKSVVKPIAIGCNYKGTCHKINEPFQEGCAKKMCKTYHKNNKLYYRIISLSCKLNGDCYDLNNEVRIGCSTFKCVEKNDHSCHRVAMKRISTGCNFNGNCMADGDTTDHGCTTYQCVVTNSYRGFKSVVKPIAIGCNYNGTCHKINKLFLDGCVKKMCKTYHKNNKLYYRIVSLSCQYNGKCYDINQSVLSGCYKLTCKKKSDHSCQRVGMVRTNIGCKHCLTGKCLKPNEIVKYKCNTYKCLVDPSGRGYRSYVKKIATGCNYNGHCHNINKLFLDGCVKKMCKTYHKNNKLYYRIVSLSCKYNGKCYNINQSVQSGCYKLTCKKKSDHFCHRVGMVRTNIGCKHCATGKCLKPNEIVKYNCNTYQCLVDKTDKGYRSHVKIITTGCRYKGVCHNVDEVFTCKDKCKKVCRSYYKGKTQWIKLVSLSCKFNGKCYDINKKFNIGCNTYMCVEKRDHSCKRLALKKLSSKCKKNGKCYSSGETYTERYKDNYCKVYKCNQGRFHLKLMCRTPNGKCIRAGSNKKWKATFSSGGSRYQCNTQCSLTRRHYISLKRTECRKL